MVEFIGPDNTVLLKLYHSFYFFSFLFFYFVISPSFIVFNVLFDISRPDGTTFQVPPQSSGETSIKPTKGDIVTFSYVYQSYSISKFIRTNIPSSTM